MQDARAASVVIGAQRTPSAPDKHRDSAGARTIDPALPTITPDQIQVSLVDLGRQLASRRHAAGLTQHQLAVQVTYARSGIANIETGRQNAPYDLWRRADLVLRADGALIKAAADLVALKRAFTLQTAEQGRSANEASLCANRRECPCIQVIPRWTGREIRALREAIRLDPAAYALTLNVPTAVASGWERRPSRQPAPAVQAVLDRLLLRVGPDVHARFRLLLDTQA